MNPVLLASLRLLKRRRRTCPSCKRSQLVDPDKVDRTVPCRYCKTPMPPKKGDG